MFRDADFWQYSAGSHSGATRVILDLIVLSIMFKDKCDIDTCHLIVEISFQWVIDKNLTRRSDMKHKMVILFIFQIRLKKKQFLPYLYGNKRHAMLRIS